MLKSGNYVSITHDIKWKHCINECSNKNSPITVEHSVVHIIFWHVYTHKQSLKLS